jgi:glyoxylase-like metal-dependent hydrolase (beta-lactamase superfamily II)
VSSTDEDDLAFTVSRPPAFGALTDVAPGLYWVRLPLPLRLNHVNCWVLDDGASWTVIDAGLNTDDIFEIWDGLLRGLLKSRPVGDLVLTHGHTDHIGFAAELVARTKCRAHCSLAEWLNAMLIWHEREEPLSEQFIVTLKSNGCSEEAASAIKDAQRKPQHLGLRPPREFTRLQDGDSIRMGRRDWRVIAAGGHSPEHLSFYCEADGILIAGDQVLSHITPGLVVPAAQPTANPMKDYVDSLARFEALPANTLVLPSHGLPFRNLHARLKQTRDHHRLRLADMASLAEARVTAFDVIQEVFPRLLHENPRQALGETLAHLNMLVFQNVLTREVEGGLVTFRRV